MGRVVIGGSPYLLTPALQLMSCPSVLVPDAGHSENTANALLCRLG